jgi:LysM repeat protein
MRPGDVLKAGHTLVIPVGGRDVTVASDEGRGGSATSSRRVHVVRAGETLSGIAARLGVRQADLKAWNGMTGTRIRAGQKLVYREGAGTADVLLMAASSEYYRVRSGDNLWAISSRFGNTVDDLKRLNDGLTEDLQPGQRIRVR